MLSLKEKGVSSNKELLHYKRILESAFKAIRGVIVILDSDYRILLSNTEDYPKLSVSAAAKGRVNGKNSFKKTYYPRNGKRRGTNGRRGTFVTEADVSINGEEGKRKVPFCYKELMGRNTPCPFCSMREVFKTGQPTSFRTKNANGRRVLDVHLYPIKNNEGGVAQVVEYFEDVTREKEAEEGLEELTRELERKGFERTMEHQKTILRLEKEIGERKKIEKRYAGILRQLENANKELESFSYSVSHDLKAPLRSIDGFSLAIYEDYENLLDENGREYLGKIRTSVKKMATLIEDLLSFSRITRSKIQSQRVSISELSESIITGLKQTEPNREVSVRIQRGLYAWADYQLISLVLENLLGNAWKYTARNNRAEITMGLTEKADGEWFYIKDNGVGFNMKYAEQLFQPFKRLHNQKEFSGSGIGLATVCRIISRHGGTIFAESVEGEGATFYFTLPSKENGSSEDQNDVENTLNDTDGLEDLV